MLSNGTPLTQGSVKATACGLRVTDRVSAETQNVVDEANDVVAVKPRSTPVRARLAELEEGIRAGVKQVDAEGAQA